MDQQQWLAEQFEEQRPRLRAVAWRMLGSASEADDALQNGAGGNPPATGPGGYALSASVRPLDRRIPVAPRERSR
jgi:hypothetical protein